MDLTKIRELTRETSITVVNSLLQAGWVILAIEDGEYLLARIR